MLSHTTKESNQVHCKNHPNETIQNNYGYVRSITARILTKASKVVVIAIVNSIIRIERLHTH